MYARSIIIPALAGLVCSVSAESSPFDSFATLFKRQNNANSTCNAYGIDFQDGGDYFINTNSNESFTCVTKFEGCNNDKADIMLVNESSGDEYDCTQVNTVPDDESMLSTCPVLKNQLTSGEYLILAIGNNGNGNPFAWQREFSIDAGPQQTSTVTPTATYSVTTQPTITTTTTSTIRYTSTISNNSTITMPAATHIVTKTPDEVTVTSTHTHTRTFWRWTKTQSVETATVTPQCTVPPKPRFPDPICRWKPKNHPLPFGINIKARADRPADVEVVRKRFENMRAAKARAANEAQITKAPHAKRDADEPTVTVTADQAVNSTITITAAPSTDLETTITSDIVYSTQPPSTVRSGTEIDTTWAPTPTDTVRSEAYTRTIATKTWAVTWTYTTTTTPAADATACVSQGGHFGHGFGFFQPHWKA